MNEDLLIYALGGESLAAPSDTMPAYWGALGAGADGLLVGVQRTSDGVLVCCSQDSLEPTTGDGRSVGEVTAGELARLDAGARFRSTELDSDNRPSGRGDDTPWDGSRQIPLYHPRLDELLLTFGRRAHLLLEPLAPGGDPAELVEPLVAALRRFGLDTGGALIVGGRGVMERAGDAGRAYRAAAGEAAADAQRVADELGCEAAIVGAAGWGGDLSDGPALLVAGGPDDYALSPALFAEVAEQASGLVARSVDSCRALIREPVPAVTDDFAGTSLDRSKWVAGYSKANQDTVIRQQDGLHIEIKEGGEYSGAAALTVYAIPGPFDARIDFEVENPHQGTTFELAAIQVDPGYHHMDNSDLDKKSVNLTFDVHGAPPYASSERDENDGFRIGWNNGPAVTEFSRGFPQSSNIYNKYSRDVGDGAADNPAGSLRLVRHGAVFNAYYRDRHNRAWVLSGSASVPTLADEVFLRLGAKHWPKGGRTPPRNAFHFTDFRLFLI